MRNVWIPLLLALLGLLVLALVALDRSPRGQGDALESAVGEASLALEPRTEASLAPAGTGQGDADPGSRESKPTGARVEAGTEAGRKVEQAAAPVAQSAEKPVGPKRESDEAILDLRINVWGEAGWVPEGHAAALVTVHFADTGAELNAPTFLGRSAEFEVPWKGTRGLPTGCQVIVSHPGYCLYRQPLDLTRAAKGEGRDEQGRVWTSVRHNVALKRYAARLSGAVEGAEHVALLSYAPARPPELLEIVDYSSAGGGQYVLRVPKLGEWIVVALRDGAHPTYALVDVLRPTEAGMIAEQLVPHVLRTLETQLRVDVVKPVGYDPAGLAIEVAPVDGLEKSADDRPIKPPHSVLPALVWHRTSVDAPGAGMWGVDLRRPEPQVERRDSIVWQTLNATIDAAGGALVTGGPTGDVLVSVQDPFEKDRFEPCERRDFGFIDSTIVTPPVARIDVRAFGAEGPLEGGRANANWLTGRHATRDRRKSGARAPRREDLEVEAAFNADGFATLYVPSTESLTVVALDALGARTASRRLVAPAPARSFLITLTVESAAPRDAPR